MSLRILLVDDHRIMRDGLRLLVEKEPDMQVIAEAANGRDAIRLVRELSPDVIVLDVGMPELNGIEATRQIKALRKEIKVIALSMHCDRRFIAEMLSAGASGYVLKDCAFSDLAQGIRAVAGNETYLCPRVADVMVKDYVSRLSLGTPNPSELPSLTPREREVLQLLAEGKATKQVAALLEVSVKTIETHRQRIMQKLQLRSLPELTKYAIREGLTSLDR